MSIARRLSAAALAALMTLGLTACSGGEESSTAAKSGLEDGVLTVAMECAYAPYNWTQADDSNGAVPIKDSNNYANGYDVIIAKKLAEELGVELEIVPLEWSAVLTGVGAGKYDMAVAGMAYTPERAETMAMSKVYKPGGDQGLLVPADKVDEYTSLDDFAGKKVGFQSGTVQEQNVLTQLPDSEPVTFDIIQNAVLALDSGKVDAVSVSIANGEMFVSTNPKLAVSTVQFDNSQNGNVIGFPKGETELVDAVNKIIDEVLEQGLYDQWLEEATAEAENLGL